MSLNGERSTSNAIARRGEFATSFPARQEPRAPWISQVHLALSRTFFRQQAIGEPGRERSSQTSSLPPALMMIS
jgi:hypothetical protein